ncbi:hypothetical protein E1A91_D06G090900v1 [Gossypium mustelinum]|uniref:Uncharacterized protein n=1 Tax=Gossypium mustelinum TaxID=34275 RepID=A0A5D2UG35_GOSMU|nr:hypothetical protein E1A91_D06G090900v1 [Gossypium mustelinum]
MNSVLQIVFILLYLLTYLELPLASKILVAGKLPRDSSIKRLYRKGRDLAWVGTRTAKGGGFIVCDGQSL